MAYYSEISSFTLACARIARSFSWRDARDALWNKYINVQFEDYHITFSYAEGGVLNMPARVEFDLVNEQTGDFLTRIRLHTYEGDRDDLPMIRPSTAERIASELAEAIYRDMNCGQEGESEDEQEGEQE